MPKNCPNCGAPICSTDSECQYCGTEIEGRERCRDDYNLPIVPYGGKIMAEIALPMQVVLMFTDKKGLEHYCKERILSEMAEEIIKHIEIQTYVKPTMDFREGPYRVRGTLTFGKVPEEDFFCRINGRNFVFGGKEHG